MGKLINFGINFKIFPFSYAEFISWILTANINKGIMLFTIIYAELHQGWFQWAGLMVHNIPT